MIVVQNGLARSIALETSNFVTGCYYLIAGKDILMAFQLFANPQGLLHIGIDISKMMIVVATVIILLPCITIDQKIVMGLEVCTPIVIVHIFLRRIVVNEEIVMDLSPFCTHGWSGIIVFESQKGLPVPAVERAICDRAGQRCESDSIVQS